MKVITLDIGGTTIKSAIIEDYNILVSRKQSTMASEGIDAIIKSIISSVEILQAGLGNDYGIAISSAGDIDPCLGKVIYASDNLPNYSGLELARMLTDKFHVKTTVINDAMAAILGERAVGACQGVNSCVMLTLGTGLGGAVIVDGKLLLGENYRAGRFGHVAMVMNGRQCTCGRKGCAEQYVSATGLVKTARECGIECKDSNEIAKYAREGSAAAKDAIDIFSANLAQVISNYNDIFDPNQIILGGGLVELAEAWLDNVKARLASDVANKIAAARLGNGAGLIGAYAYHISRK